MFHVKLIMGNRAQLTVQPGRAVRRKLGSHWFARVALTLGATLLAVSSHAVIHKCTGADGKVTFGDQPCAVGQSSGTVKPAAAAPPAVVNSPGSASTVVARDPDAAARAAAIARIRASQTAECVALSDRIIKVANTSGGAVPEAEGKAMVERNDKQCMAAAQAANAAENARNEARQKQMMVDEECKQKRRVLAERRPRLASLSSDDKAAFAAVEADVSRVCR